MNAYRLTAVAAFFLTRKLSFQNIIAWEWHLPISAQFYLKDSKDDVISGAGVTAAEQHSNFIRLKCWKCLKCLIKWELAQYLNLPPIDQLRCIIISATTVSQLSQAANTQVYSVPISTVHTYCHGYLLIVSCVEPIPETDAYLYQYCIPTYISNISFWYCDILILFLWVQWINRCEIVEGANRAHVCCSKRSAHDWNTNQTLVNFLVSCRRWRNRTMSPDYKNDLRV